MKTRTSLMALATALTVLAMPVHAACTAEYKASRENPLRLDHGFVEVPDNACTNVAALAYVSETLASEGWTNIKIISLQRDD